MHPCRTLSSPRQPSFADISFDLPPSSPVAGVEGRVVLGVRPTDFEHGATAEQELPRVRVKADVVEDLGSESHVIFTIDAPRVTAEAVRAATSTARTRAGSPARPWRSSPLVRREAPCRVRAEVELLLPIYRRLRPSDPATAWRWATRPKPAKQNLAEIFTLLFP